MSNVTASLPPDVDRGPRLEAAYWTWSAVAIILVSLRFYARIKIRGLGWDDWLMLFTVILFVATTCIVTYMASIGGGRHVYYLTTQQQLQAVKWSWISQPTAIFLFVPGKASIAMLTLRFMGRNTVWRRAILYWIIATIFIVNSLGVIFTFVQCDPPRAIWTPGLQSHCWDPKVQEHYNFFVAAYNIASDVVLALLPATIISKLNLKPRKKIALCILLGLGLICAVFSAIKLPYLIELTARADFTWSAYDVEMWTGAEAFVMIFCGCIPPLQPLWDRKIFGSRKIGSSYAHMGLKERSNGTQSVGLRSKSTAKNMTMSQTELSDYERTGPEGWSWSASGARDEAPSQAVDGNIMATTTVDVTAGPRAV